MLSDLFVSRMRGSQVRITDTECELEGDELRLMLM